MNETDPVDLKAKMNSQIQLVLAGAKRLEEAAAKDHAGEILMAADFLYRWSETVFVKAFQLYYGVRPVKGDDY